MELDCIYRVRETDIVCVSASEGTEETAQNGGDQEATTAPSLTGTEDLIESGDVAGFEPVRPQFLYEF